MAAMERSDLRVDLVGEALGRQGPFYVGSVGLGPVCVIRMDGVGNGQTKDGVGGKPARSVRATLSHFFAGNEGAGRGKLVQGTDHNQFSNLVLQRRMLPSIDRGLHLQ